jgi:signal transduction histidine kinase
MIKPKILVVEDEAITAHDLRRILGRLGYDVVGVAATGKAGLDQLERTNPDLLLADIGLGGDIDGIEVAARARDEGGIPTIFLTAYNDPETMRRARITEPYAYLLKPFAEQELHATIEIALQQKVLRGEQEQKAKATAQILVRTQEELSAVTERLFRVQEEERKGIARDLHDDIGQRLALLQIGLEELWQKIPAELRSQHDREFKETIRRSGELSEAVRSVSHRLHPAILDDLGLVPALRELAETFVEHYGILTRFSARSVPDDLSPQISLPLYRIAQEALRNVRQHAGPAVVNIGLIGGLATIKLSIRDSGNGFDPQHPKQRVGLGLISMAERAQAAGGELRIYSRPGEGTRIHVSIPLAQHDPGLDTRNGFADDGAGRSTAGESI